MVKIKSLYVEQFREFIETLNIDGSNIQILQAMNPQRKQDLLKDLDAALSKKVQEKYYKHSKTQQLNYQPQPEAPSDRTKRQSAIQSGKPYRTKEQFVKSPINMKKSAEKLVSLVHLKHQKVIDAEHVQVIKNQRGYKARTSHCLSPSGVSKKQQQLQALVDNLKSGIFELESENQFLSSEVNSFKSSIRVLQNQSRLLKREQSEYHTLKHQNSSLLKEIQELKVNAKSRPTRDGSLVNNLSFEECLKNLMMLVSVTFIGKEWNEQFVYESIKNISRQVSSLVNEKNKLVSKLNKFDVDTILIKQNNQSYQQEVDDMMVVLNNYESELSACKTTINQLEEQFSSLMSRNKQLESKNREMSRELEWAKKELKVIFDSSRHRKPKRQSSVIKREKDNWIEESTVVRNYCESSSQTSIKEQAQEVSCSREDYKILKEYEEKISLQNDQMAYLATKVAKLSQQLTSKSSQNEQLVNRVHDFQQIQLLSRQQMVELQEQAYHRSEYIRQLQEKSQQIDQDVSRFMPQLKQIQEENNKLKEDSLHKDEQLLNKLRIINEVRGANQSLQEDVNRLQIDVRRRQMEIEHKVKENQMLTNQLELLMGKNSSLQASIVQQSEGIKTQINTQIYKLQQEIQQKEHKCKQLAIDKEEKGKQIEKLSKEVECQKLFSHKLNEVNKNCESQLRQLNEKLQHNQSTFLCQKSKFKEAIQQIMIINCQLTKKQTHYQNIYYTIQQKCQSFQSQSNQVVQGYTQLELNLKQMEQETKVLKDENEKLKVIKEGLEYQLKSCKFQAKRFEGEIEDRNKRQVEYKRVNSELQVKYNLSAQKYEEILRTNANKEKLIGELEGLNSQSLSKMSYLEGILQQKSVQEQKLHLYFDSLNQQNMSLSKDLDKTKQDLELTDKSKNQQLTNQSFDIERLIRENKELRNQVEQLKVLSHSKQFQHHDYDQKITTLTEQNQSLSLKLQYLTQQLQMKEKNKAEDQYIVELKNKQYCLMIRKILSNMIDTRHLEYCESLDQLLEIGSQKIVDKRKEERDEDSLKKKSQVGCQYQLHFNREQVPRKLIFGTEITSYEDLGFLSGREKKQNCSKAKEYINSASPRSFIFNLSPTNSPSQPPEKPTNPLVSQYGHEIK